jgi:hypothetical protein
VPRYAEEEPGFTGEYGFTLAYEVCAQDDDVDFMKNVMQDQFAEEMRKDQGHVEAMINLFLVSRHLERIADHATNIAEDVIYMITGEIHRHRGADYVRRLVWRATVRIVGFLDFIMKGFHISATPPPAAQEKIMARAGYPRIWKEVGTFISMAAPTISAASTSPSVMRLAIF